MKIKFLHSSMYFDKATASDITYKPGQTVDMDDLDAESFIAQGRAEKTSGEKVSHKVEAKNTPVTTSKMITKQATKKATPKKATKK